MNRRSDPTQATDAEQALLGALMLDPECIDECDLRVEHFGQAAHQSLYRCILHVRQTGPVDAITVQEYAISAGEETGGLGYLVQMCQSSSGRYGLAGYVRIIRDAYKRRMASTIARRMLSEIGHQDAISSAVSALIGLDTEHEMAEVGMREAMSASFRELEAAFQRQGELPGVTTGFSKLDGVTGGWQAGDLAIIQARPSMGKTALMLSMASAAAKTGCHVGIVSGEQPASQLSARILSMGSGIPLQAIRSADLDDSGWGRITETMRRVVDLPITMFDRSAPTLEEVASQCRRWSRSGVRAVFVDYLQRMVCDAPTRREEVSKIARGLKTIARDCNIAIIALAQSTRDVDNRTNKRPGLADIAESADCEREADSVISLYRDDVYDQDSRDAGRAELVVVKNRHGAVGVVNVAFVAASVRFAELARSQP